MQVVSDSEWLGLKTHRSHAPSDTVVLLKLRIGLRGLYQHLLDEPLPEHLARLVRELERREPAHLAQPE